MDPLLRNSLCSVRELLANGSVSAAELLSVQLGQIEACDNELNCFIALRGDEAASAASAFDAAGDQDTLLGGVPLACKDIFHTPAHAPSAGSTLLPDTSSTHATAVARLREAGAVLLGWLNLDEFAAGGTGDNQHFGRCRNPWNTAHITGGSSGGSAAAVAAHLCFGALGSDAGGSIRIPAALCGVTGLKPTYGLVSRHGAAARTWSMDCIGPLARSAADCALLLDAVAGIDPLDSSSVDARSSGPYAIAGSSESLRIGIAREYADAGLSPAMGQAFDDTVQTFAHLGAAIVETSLGDVDLLNQLQQVIVKSEGAALLGRLFRQHEQEISAPARSVLQEGFMIPATRYIEALAMRGTELARFTDTAFAGCDLVLAPVVADSAPAAADLRDEATAVADYFNESARFTRFANYLGIPAISIPCGFDSEELPLGVQLIGAPFSEKRLLSVAHRFQQATDHHQRTISGTG